MTERKYPRVQHPSYGESKVRSEFQEECHLPTMIRRWRKAGVLDEMVAQKRPSTYGDFSAITDYKSALDAVRDAEQAFLTLPPAVRLQFGNDPHELLKALEEPAMVETLTELGVYENLAPSEPAPEAPTEAVQADDSPKQDPA